MRGRYRGQQERIIILAHQSEMMARQKTLKPLAKYLEPTKAPAKKGAVDVLAMFRRVKAKQDAKGIHDG